MTRPVLKIEIGFASPPSTTLALTTWTDVSSYVRADQPVTIRRGRNDELTATQAGTATFILDNRDRRFDPDYTSGPYGSNVKPMRRVRIRGTWNGIDYYLYTGYVTTYQPNIIGKDAVTVVQCIDAIGASFARTKFGASDTLSQATSSAQISTLLNNIGWSTDERAIFSGLSTIQTQSLANKTVMQTIQGITESENGYFFMSRDGKATFYDRQWRLRATSSTTYSDIPTGSEIPYEDLQLEYGDRYIYTEVVVSREGGATATASDSAAQSLYFRRTLSRSGLLITNDAELSDAANWLLSIYSSPSTRVSSVTINGELQTSAWPTIMSTDLQSICTVKRTPIGGGSVISRDVWVEAIDWNISREAFRCVWRLSPDETGSYWILGDSVKGVLGSTTRLAY
jgi:hypothetical protein